MTDPISLSASEHQLQLRRAVIASTIGTTIEWYDFFLYSTLTGLVFAKLLFSHSDPWVGMLEAFAIYAVGFVAVGAAIFGHYGDLHRLATWLFTTFQSATAIAVYIALCAVITLGATAAMTDHTGKDISGEYRTPRSRAQM